MTRFLVEAHRFSKYGVIGLASNAVLYFLFIALVYLGLSPVATAGLCYILGVSVSYIANRKWTFSSTEGHSRDLPKFLLAYGVGLASTLVTISVLLLWMPPELAQLINVAITAVVIYGMLRLLRFGGKGKDRAY